MAFIRPQLKYANVVWDPHTVKDTGTLEAAQRFASKVCCKRWDITYEQRLYITS